jgi:uncharacterized membrane protein (TIGR02234 family)
VTGRRGLLLALGGCVLGGSLVLLAAGRTWGRVGLTGPTGAHLIVQATGRDAVSSLPALGLALLVLAAGILASRSWLRFVVGLVVVTLGGVVIAVAVRSSDDVTAALQRKAFGVPPGAVHVSFSGWAVVAAAGGAVAVAAGALTVLRGTTWPGLGARYDSPDGAGRASARPVEPATAAWDALDRGEDPTK